MIHLDLSPEQLAALRPYDFTFTSASVDLFEACPASGVFAGPKDKPTHGGMWYGIFVHRFLEYVTNRGADHAYAYIRQKKAEGRPGSSKVNAANVCERIDVDSIPPGEAEVSYAQDLASGDARRLWGRFDRARPGEQFGRADLMFHQGMTPHVADYKCGVEAADPNTHPQLLGLACAIRAETAAPEVLTSIIGVLSSGELRWFTVLADRARMDWFEDRMRRVHLRMSGDRAALRDHGVAPPFAPGAHCNGCHAQSVCPAVPAPRRV